MILAGSAQAVGRSGRPWSIGRHLLICLLWFALSIAATVAASLAMLQADRLIGWQAAVGAADADAIDFFVGTAVQAMVILAGCSLAARCHADEPRRWLGDRPMQRRMILIGLIALDAFYVLATTLIRARGAADAPSFEQHAWWGHALMISLAVLLGPLWEEWFFRGWLWAGLRERCTPAVTGLVTAALWLACHLPAGLAQTLALVPVAVLLTIARQQNGSVRASFILHALNNGLSILAARLLLVP